MRISVLSFGLCLFFAGISAFGQVGNATITGLLTDPAGAVVAGAGVQVKSQDTGVVYSGASTNAGLYTVTDLPVGTYSVTVTVSGFKTYTHTNLAVGAAQTLEEN